MKILKQILPVITLLLALFSAPLVRAQEAPSLYGSWKADWAKTLSHASAEEKSLYDSLPASMKQRLRDGIASRTYTFNASGAVSISWEGGQSRNMSGNWSWNPAQKVLTLSVNTASRDYSVAFGDNNCLVLTSPGPSQGSVFRKIVIVRL